MKTKIYSLFAIITLSLTAWSQGVGINETGNNPNPSAILDVESTDKGFLPPRMTEAQRDGITSPAKGLIVYNTDEDCIQVNNGTPASPNWECLSTGTPAFQDIRGNVQIESGNANTAASDTYFFITNGPSASILTIPALTANTNHGKTMWVFNQQTAGSITVNGSITINPGRSRCYVWSGTAWLPLAF